MARIRTIKPEFWSDEKIVKLSFPARLLFIGLWNFSDDSGCYWYEPDRLAMQVFPRDPEVNVAVLIDELIGEKIIELREREDGREYIIVHHFPQHQKIDHPSASRIQTMPYKKRSIPFAARRAIALKYWAEPGGDPKIVNCHYCGEEGKIFWPKKRNGEPSAWVHFPLEIDHLVPEKDGGTENVDNLVLACKSCNRSKAYKSEEQFIKSREVSRGLAPEGNGMEGKGREGITDNNRPEQRGPDELRRMIEKAAAKTTASAAEGAGDFGEYRLPKSFGKYGGVHVANVPPDECEFLLKKMKPGPMVAAALRWRIALKKQETRRP